MMKAKASEKSLSTKRGKKVSTKAAIKKASNLAAARKDRYKKEEEKTIYVNVLTEIREACDNNTGSETAQTILKLFKQGKSKKGAEIASLQNKNQEITVKKSGPVKAGEREPLENCGKAKRQKH